MMFEGNKELEGYKSPCSLHSGLETPVKARISFSKILETQVEILHRECRTYHGLYFAPIARL